MLQVIGLIRLNYGCKLFSTFPDTKPLLSRPLRWCPVRYLKKSFSFLYLFISGLYTGSINMLFYDDILNNKPSYRLLLCVEVVNFSYFCKNFVPSVTQKCNWPTCVAVENTRIYRKLIQCLRIIICVKTSCRWSLISV